ncbi:BAK_1a_G0056240.mRNA.1.CDS.1 [Saccharomyces cerevisiae]|nr:BAK_1a_G0056240.mRNA.1.CDS.1 [Saccharomyces cerevisiae]CAI7393342.1 BAK_1a_G0056240.mRNA.1.CDS.1 [Saccharomyces cerevisiae]
MILLKRTKIRGVSVSFVSLQRRTHSRLVNPIRQQHQQITKQRSSKILKNAHFYDFRSLPKVPTTQYLEARELTRDILYSGYRPVMYPVKENPLFRDKKRKSLQMLLTINEKTNAEAKTIDEKKHKNILFGERGTGGIMSGGVNGTWKYNPTVPNELLPFNWWSTSSMGMEYFPEWKNVPPYMMRKLKPFDKALQMRLTHKSKKKMK